VYAYVLEAASVFLICQLKFFIHLSCMPSTCLTHPCWYDHPEIHDGRYKLRSSPLCPILQFHLQIFSSLSSQTLNIWYCKALWYIDILLTSSGRNIEFLNRWYCVNLYAVIPMIQWGGRSTFSLTHVNWCSCTCPRFIKHPHHRWLSINSTQTSLVT
jgi:hypothetical protein